MLSYLESSLKHGLTYLVNSIICNGLKLTTNRVCCITADKRAHARARGGSGGFPPTAQPKKQLIIAEITDEYVHDTTYLEDALKAVGKRRGKVLIDGITNSGKCYRLVRKYNKTLYTPPNQRA